MFGRRCFQLRLCGAVGNRTYREHSPDFSLTGRRGFLTSPTGSVQLILKSTINSHLFILLVAFFGVESVVAEHLKQIGHSRLSRMMFRHLVVDVGCCSAERANA